MAALPARGVIVEYSTGSAAGFHGREVPAELAEPTVWVHEVGSPALVLGSSQRIETVDVAACERRGLDIVRRRSGGGAVLLEPDTVSWLDVLIPTGGPGWHRDVNAQMIWLGERLADALSVTTPTVHRGAMIRSAWSNVICFDGVGAGELLVGDAKLVGISQRRTRDWVRLQCCWYHRYRAADLLGLLMNPPPTNELRPVATVPAALSAFAVASSI